MFIYKIYMFFFALKTATCSCNYEVRSSFFEKEKMKSHKEGKLPVCINENSGMVKAWQDGFYWTHNDSGGSPELYMVNSVGQLFDTLRIPDANNIDWEDLAKDTKGNVYVGDFGNNLSKRKDLTIYKKGYNKVEKITFEYADQDFTDTLKSEYDCEAFFWYNDSLYLFTKSWTKGKKKSKVYALPDQEGHYSLQPIDESFFKAPVTGADVSPDGSKFALITYGKILLFGIENKKIDFRKPLQCIKIGKNQTEALVFENDRKIIYSNEQRKIYSIEI